MLTMAIPDVKILNLKIMGVWSLRAEDQESFAAVCCLFSHNKQHYRQTDVIYDTNSQS